MVSKLTEREEFFNKEINGFKKEQAGLEKKLEKQVEKTLEECGLSPNVYEADWQVCQTNKGIARKLCPMPLWPATSPPCLRWCLHDFLR